MDGFALSERWNGWSDLNVMAEAARAAADAGPLDPIVCEITLDWDDDETTLHSLEELQALLRSGAVPEALEIEVAHIVESEASLNLAYNGRWLQINGAGSDWERAGNAYRAAQVEIALVAGITTFKLPTLPRDTVAETRKRLNQPPEA